MFSLGEATSSFSLYCGSLWLDVMGIVIVKFGAHVVAVLFRASFAVHNESVGCVHRGFLFPVFSRSDASREMVEVMNGMEIFRTCIVFFKWLQRQDRGSVWDSTSIGISPRSFISSMHMRSKERTPWRLSLVLSQTGSRHLRHRRMLYRDLASTNTMREGQWATLAGRQEHHGMAQVHVRLVQRGF